VGGKDTGDFELWLVVKPSVVTGYQYVAVLGVLGGSIYFHTSMPSSNGNAGVYCSAGEKDFGAAVSNNVAHLLRFYRVSGTLFCDVDGVTAPSSWPSTDNLTAIGSIFDWGVYDGASMQGCHAEFLLINGSLTTGERDALKANIAAYYGLTVA